MSPCPPCTRPLPSQCVVATDIGLDLRLILCYLNIQKYITPSVTLGTQHWQSCASILGLQFCLMKLRAQGSQQPFCHLVLVAECLKCCPCVCCGPSRQVVCFPNFDALPDRQGCIAALHIWAHQLFVHAVKKGLRASPDVLLTCDLHCSPCEGRSSLHRL